MPGYKLATVDTRPEERCSMSLKSRGMKDDVKNVMCTVTNPKQCVMEKVSQSSSS